jgi:hypothetical protein
MGVIYIVLVTECAQFTARCWERTGCLTLFAHLNRRYRLLGRQVSARSVLNDGHGRPA